MTKMVTRHENPASALRLFVALWPRESVRYQLRELAQSVLAKTPGRLILPQNLHLTLAFLGQVDAEHQERLESALDRMVLPDPFKLVIDSIGCWRRRGILWAGCTTEAPELIRLVASLSRALAACGHSADTREFKTHITLARNVRHYRGLAPHGKSGVERRRGDPLDPVAPIEWGVEEFCLAASELHPAGACYRVLRSWRLLGNTVHA